MATGLMIGSGSLVARAAADRVKNIKKTTQSAVPDNASGAAYNTAANSRAATSAQPAAAVSPTTAHQGNTATPQIRVGVRSALNDAGYDNSRIGWDGANVTVDGKKFITPDSVVDGTSYASKNNLYSAINDRLASEGDSAQAATDYWSGKGVSNGVQYVGNGLVSMGGKTVKPLYITDDGKAIFRTSDLDAAFAEWKADSGYKTGADVFNQTQDKYGGMIDDALSDVLSRREWEYDIDNDEAYKAYRDMYTREGNRAMEDAVASMSGQTGGYVNSAALTAGGQAQNYYMQQLADRIPELQANDYNRYLGEQELRRAALNSVMGVSDDYYSKLNQTAAADRAAINNAFDTNYSRNMAERQWQDAHAQNLQAQALNDYALRAEAAEAPYYADNARLENESRALDNQAAQQSILINQMNMQQAQIENAFANASARGYFTEDEAAILGVHVSTNPYAAEATYRNMMNHIELEKQKLSAELKEQGGDVKLTPAQVLAAYNDGVESDELMDMYHYYFGETPSETAARKIAENEEYGTVYNRLAEMAQKKGYDEIAELGNEQIASVILKADISDKIKSNLLSDFGIDGDYAAVVATVLSNLYNEE